LKETKNNFTDFTVNLGPLRPVYTNLDHMSDLSSDWLANQVLHDLIDDRRFDLRSDV